MHFVPSPFEMDEEILSYTVETLNDEDIQNYLTKIEN